MEDEDLKKQNQDREPSSGSFGDVMKRVGEGIVDGIAEKNPLIGRPLQYGLNAAGFNTEGYQDIQDRRAKNKEALIAAQNANREFEAGMPLREAERKRKLALLSRRGDKELEFLDAKDEQALATQDAIRMNAYLGEAKKGLKQQLEGNGLLNNFRYDEADDMINSGTTRNLLELEYYLKDVMAVGNGDKNAYSRLDRAFKQNGLDLVDGNDGIRYVSVPSLGMSIPATKEGIAGVRGIINDQFLEEVKSRQQIIDANTKGDPLKRSIAMRSKALMPYVNGSAKKAIAMVKDQFDQATPEEQTWHVLNRGIKDWQDTSIPAGERLAGLERAGAFLQKLGYEVEGLDPKNPDPDKAIILDRKNGGRMSFGAFAVVAQNNDVLGQKLDNQHSLMQYNSRQQAQMQMKKDIMETRNALNPGNGGAKKGKAGNQAGGNGQGGEPTNESQFTDEDVKKMAAKYGDHVIGWKDKQLIQLQQANNLVGTYARRHGVLGKDKSINLDNPDEIRAVRDQFEKERESLKLPKVNNPWDRYYEMSLKLKDEREQTSLRQTIVPESRKRAETIYRQHADELKKHGIKNFEDVITQSIKENMPQPGMHAPIQRRILPEELQKNVQYYLRVMHKMRPRREGRTAN